MRERSSLARPKTRLYVATSLDGFIADADGGVDWLERFDPNAYGFTDFMSEVGAIVMGRRTYEQVRTFAETWPYDTKPCVIIASKPLARLPASAETAADLASALAKADKAAAGRDVWIVGGAVTMRSAIEARVIDRIDHFIVPVLLGRGLPLLPDLSRTVALEFESVQTYRDGVVRLRYALSR